MIPSMVIKGFLRWQRGYNIFAEAKPEIPSRHCQLRWPIRTQDLFHLSHMQNLRIIILLCTLGAGLNNVYPRESWLCIVLKHLFFFAVGSFCAVCPNCSKVNNAICQINLYALNSAIGFPRTYSWKVTYPMDSGILSLNYWGQMFFILVY